MVLSEYVLLNFTFGVSWDEVTDALYYTAQIGSGNTFTFRNLLNFFFTDLNSNTSYTITIKAYDEDDVELDSGTLTRTTLNGVDSDDIDPFIKFTTKIKEDETDGTEFDPESEDEEIKYNSLYSNCNALFIYYNSSEEEDLDETDIYDPNNKPEGNTLRYDTAFLDGNPPTRILTRGFIEDETGEEIPLPDDWPEDEPDPFPVTQKLYFSLGFTYMDPSGSDDPLDLYCIPETSMTPTKVFPIIGQETEKPWVSTSKCKVIFSNATCGEHYVLSSSGSRYQQV